jgi:glycosyltransferase involved in cell wall biosynthesis
MIRTLHVCYSFPPDPLGGTEVYVRALCQSLDRFDIGSVVVAPGARDDTYEIDGVRVRRFEHRPTSSLSDIYAGDPEAAARFGAVLDAECPDLVHQHALSPACSPRLAAEAKKRVIPVVFTYHTPTASCLRGTLLERGTDPCDGRLDVKRCTACNLDARGVSGWPARLLATVPPAGGDALAALNQQGGAWTALRMSSLARQYADSIAGFWSQVDRIVVLTPWVGRLLAVNGVPAEKLVASVHGLPATALPRLADRTASTRLRVVHLGRIDPVKGTGLLIRALRALPDAPINLDIYGIVQHESDRPLQEQLRELTGGDARIRLHAPLPYGDVIGTLRQYDLIAVPSQWMETGPLVVLEAFAAGVPVLASSLGGLTDKIRDGVDGVLVRPFDSVDAWRAALDRLSRAPELVTTLTQGVTAPRLMGEVAGEMAAVYRSLTENRDDEPARHRIAHGVGA